MEENKEEEVELTRYDRDEFKFCSVNCRGLHCLAHHLDVSATCLGWITTSCRPPAHLT